MAIESQGSYIVESSFKLQIRSNLGSMVSSPFLGRGPGGLGTAPYLGVMFSFAWSQKLKLFIGVGNNLLYRSNDGITFTDISSSIGSTGSWAHIIWSSELEKFIAISSSNGANGDATKRVIISSDGITWAAITAPQHNWTKITYSSSLNKLCVISSTNDMIMSSTDGGLTWSAYANTGITGGTKTGISWSPKLGMFVVIIDQSPTAPTSIMTSNDCVTWTPITLSTTYRLYSITWSNELEMFLIVGNNIALRSYNGTTWTASSMSGSGLDSIYDVVWSPEYEMFMAAGYNASGGTPVARSSFDGITWSLRSHSGYATGIVGLLRGEGKFFTYPRAGFNDNYRTQLATDDRIEAFIPNYKRIFNYE